MNFSSLFCNFFKTKKFFAGILFFLNAFFLFSFSQSDIKTFTLENGFKVFFLEDEATATVRIELNIKAGTKNQNPQNAGFFSLYANLLGLEISPDCVKTEKTVAPAQTEKIFIGLAEYFKPNFISDKKLNEELKKSQFSLKEFASSPAGFINQAIDSRIFYEEPWKTESGIFPKTFNSVSINEARTILTQIHDEYYSPQNAILYISGNITEKTALSLAKKYFEKPVRRPQNHFSEEKKFKISENQKIQKKFVITDDQLSPDLTQIVLQYTDFFPEEAELMAAVFNKNNSSFKKLLLKQRNLAIRSPQYMDVSSVSQNSRERLIIQAICEKTKVGPAVQGELFLEMSQEKERISSQEAESVLREINSSFAKISDNSTFLMKNLAIFNRTSGGLAEDFFAKNDKLNSISAEKLNESYENAKPYVFILCNTKNYTKHANEFKKYGYERITQKNGAWYLLPQYKNFINEENFQDKKENQPSEEDFNFSARRFIQKSREEFSQFTLKNGIPVTIKNSSSKNTATVMLSIAGGELLFAEKNAGLASVLANSLSAMIQWQLDELYKTGKLNSQASVNARTNSENSVLTVNCSAKDINACLEAMAYCTIFGDISPALADGISYDLRTQWRIKTGSADFQLLCEAARTIYEKPVSALYEDTKDKPAQMEFTEIQAAYPKILDCTRFSIILTGGIYQSEELKASLNSTFGELQSLSQTQNIQLKVKKLPLPKKIKRIPLRHQFFTDVSADKAGPRPAILVPTTDFSDPLLFMLETPDISSTDNAIFNALLYFLKDSLQKKLEEFGQEAKVFPADSDLPYARIVITKVKHYLQTEKIYEQAIKEISQELKKIINTDTHGFKDLEKDDFLSELENQWIINELEKTSTNEGTAFLIQKGLSSGNPELYLDQYEAVSKATAEDYYLVFSSYLEDFPRMIIYSADTKR